MYLKFISFLYTDMIQIAETLPHVRQELNLFYIVNIMGADVSATGIIWSQHIKVVILHITVTS